MLVIFCFCQEKKKPNRLETQEKGLYSCPKISSLKNLFCSSVGQSSCVAIVVRMMQLSVILQQLPKLMAVFGEVVVAGRLKRESLLSWFNVLPLCNYFQQRFLNK